MEENKTVEDENLEEVDETQEDKNETEVESENMEEILQEKEEKISEITDQFLRLQADFMNFKRRTEKDKEATMIYAIESIVKEILPTIDNLERALESEEDKEDSFYKGVELVYADLINKLNGQGIEEIASLGEEFDPNLHHAVFMEESEEYETGKVIEVLQKGYILKEKVIRPAMVKVAK